MNPDLLESLDSISTVEREIHLMNLLIFAQFLVTNFLPTSFHEAENLIKFSSINAFRSLVLVACWCLMLGVRCSR